MKNMASIYLKLSVLFIAVVFTAFIKESKAADNKKGNQGGAIRVPADQVPRHYVSAAEYGKSITSYKESPALAKLVKEGKLPPVKKRLPDEPVVVKPSKSIGKYGGTYRRAWKGMSDRWGVDKALCERIVLWEANGDRTPGVVKGIEMSQDGKTVTMKLREGLKWSDGQPVTTKDVEFQYNKVYKNEKLFSINTIHPMFKPGGVPATLQIVDKYTCKFNFTAPAATFPIEAATMSYYGIMQPAHYLKQFHPEYTKEEKLNKLMKESGEKNLQTFFSNKALPYRNPDLPVLMAWQLQNDPSDQQVVYKRNPYYFKVDTEGNQLPYIDEVVNILVEDVEMLVMKSVAGDLDFQTRDLTIANFTLLMENKDKGKYNVLLYPGMEGADVCIFLNHCVKNETKRELFNNPEFKQALSIGMNRQEINNINHMGMAKIRQAAFDEAGFIYDKEWENLHIEYDPDKANKILDELGMTKKDGNGIRLMKDGKPLEITIEFFLGHYTKDMEIIAKHWQAIGVKLISKLEDRSLMYTRYRQDNSNEALCWTFNLITRPDLNCGHWAPTSEGNGWGAQWGLYYKTKGKEGIKPPADVKRLQDIWDKIQVTVDDKNRKALMQEVIDIHKKNLFIIGVVGLSPRIAVMNKRLKNVPYFVYDEHYRSPGNAYPQQWFFD
ncbi:MAG: ABC transporter substrate-binding protein [Chitinispirillia bacterium]|jgi:peptide/nickel transport system substrate-binding protein